jgi:hypothetical protein
VWRSLP